MILVIAIGIMIVPKGISIKRKEEDSEKNNFIIEFINYISI